MANRYVMVTHLDDHWDKLKDNEASYLASHLKNGLRVEHVIGATSVPTIFVKKRKGTYEFENAWRGTVSNVRANGSKICFRVNLTTALEDPTSYRDKKVGWYSEPASLAEEQPVTSDATRNCLLPPFFQELVTTRDPARFEELCFLLIRLLGIHKAYRWPPKNQAGRADGVFEIGSLVVLYDCSLREDLEFKEQQIQNYVDQLSHDSIALNPGHLLPIPDHCHKQVWLIARGSLRQILRRGDIAVRRVSPSWLIDIYLKRLTTTMDEKELADFLRKE